MGADVFFMDMTATSRENLPQKLERLVNTAGLGKILCNKDLTAVKVHFGEQGNTAFIRPLYIRKVIRAIRKAGGAPFLTDANTLYVGTRSDAVSHIKTAVDNGFSYSSMDGAPLIIADGLFGKSETAVQVNLKHNTDVYIGSEIINANALVSVAHFKGHELSGFGGTLKNLGMGCASRRGKLDQHSNVSPKIKRKTCIGCGLCAAHCPGTAIYLKDKKAYIKKEDCIGCAECIVRCPTSSININWNQDVPVFLEKMMEYTLGVLKDKVGKALFINFITNVSPKCDCLPYAERPICNDIGVVVSTDPVAIDQAAADLVNAQPATMGANLTCNTRAGEDKFKGLYPGVDWEHQLTYAQEIGLGEREYQLVKLDTLTYKNPGPHS
ncbi:MAG: 4Fe-4S ferredoxin [Desulfobacterales bacterium]|nr:MAG: 4Fe-4S ferredoxin [Desulfobacterales bacterium]